MKKLSLVLLINIFSGACALHNLKKGEIRSVSFFGEIKTSSQEGFFNGRIAGVIMIDRFRIDVFSLFGTEEVGVLYYKGKCVFVFPKESRVIEENECRKIRIAEGEWIEVEALLSAFLKGEESHDVRVLSYRYFHGMRYPEKIVWKGKGVEVVVKIKDVEFNKATDVFFIK